MRTMNQSLATLWERRSISYEEALDLSTDKDDLLRLLQRSGAPVAVGARR
jgi:Tfp pilus assembly ATPase PilU